MTKSATTVRRTDGRSQDRTRRFGPTNEHRTLCYLAPSALPPRTDGTDATLRSGEHPPGYRTRALQLPGCPCTRFARLSRRANARRRNRLYGVLANQRASSTRETPGCTTTWACGPLVQVEEIVRPAMPTSKPRTKLTPTRARRARRAGRWDRSQTRLGRPSHPRQQGAWREEGAPSRAALRRQTRTRSSAGASGTEHGHSGPPTTGLCQIRTGRSSRS